uniref:U25-Sparatoxin-Hju1e_1 n=1 Tax=Heteropoda jugulans TaxID=1358901 RepID=A0A4Q8KD45_9ARAC
MKFAFSVVLMVITLLVVVSAEAPEVENDVSDILERGRRTCAKRHFQLQELLLKLKMTFRTY